MESGTGLMPRTASTHHLLRRSRSHLRQCPRPRSTAIPGELLSRRVDAAFNHAKKRWQLHIDETNKSKQHYTSEGYQAQLAKFASTDAAAAVDIAVDNLQALADVAAGKLGKIMAGLSPDGDTAAELRAGRFWDRAKPLLDNAKEGAVSRAQKLIVNASREELGTLLQELPSYLEARNQPTNWIEAAVSQVVPEYGQAVKRNRLAQNTLTIAKHNANGLRRTFTEGRAGSPIVLADLRGYDPDR